MRRVERRRSRRSRRSGRCSRRRPGSRGPGGSRSPSSASGRWAPARAGRRRQDEVHVGRRGAPRDRELQEPRLDAAALVDDAVAVVVDRVEAELRPRRRARLRRASSPAAPSGSPTSTFASGVFAGADGPHATSTRRSGRRRAIAPRAQRRRTSDRQSLARPHCAVCASAVLSNAQCGIAPQGPAGAPAFCCAPSATRARDSAVAFGFMTSKNACRASSPSGRRLAAQRHEDALLLR